MDSAHTEAEPQRVRWLLRLAWRERICDLADRLRYRP